MPTTDNFDEYDISNFSSATLTKKKTDATNATINLNRTGQYFYFAFPKSWCTNVCVYVPKTNSTIPVELVGNEGDFLPYGVGTNGIPYNIYKTVEELKVVEDGVETATWSITVATNWLEN